MSAATKKTRLQRGRSKTGCLQCRLRHVKCDETWPACRKCVRAKTQCSGHPSWLIQPATALAIHPDRGQTENETFHYYSSSLAPGIPGEVDQDFWIFCICPTAQSQAAVYNAVLGATSLYNIAAEQVPIPESSKAPELIRKRYQMAIEWYSRSIKACVAPGQSRTPRETILTILTSSILHMFTEIRLGHLQNAKDLIRVTYALINTSRATLIKSPDTMILACLCQILTLSVAYAIDTVDVPQDHIYNAMVLAIAINTGLGNLQPHQEYLEVINIVIKLDEFINGNVDPEACDMERYLVDYSSKWIVDGEPGYMQHTMVQIQWQVYRYGFHYQRTLLELRLARILQWAIAVATSTSQEPRAKLPWALDLYVAPLSLFVIWFWRENHIAEQFKRALKGYHDTKILVHRLIEYIEELCDTPYEETTYLESKIFGRRPKVLKLCHFSIMVSYLIEAPGTRPKHPSELDKASLVTSKPTESVLT